MAPNEQEHKQLVDRFKVLSLGTVWPVSGSNVSNVTSTFGPRKKKEGSGTTRYDWHRGIDIAPNGPNNPPTNPPVLAVASGTVDERGPHVNFPGLGNFVRLRHELLPSSQSMQYGDRQIRWYYTIYAHLDTIDSGIVEGKEISKGTALGTMGQTGSALSIHLHFELRVGTSNSLEYQLNNSNATQYGYDPHMHPFMLFRPLADPPPTYGIHHSDSETSIRAEFSCWGSQPILNAITVTVRGDTVARRLDFNRRIGYNPTSETNLDNLFWNPDKLYVDPLSWGGGNTFSTRITGPPPDVVVPLKFYDIWGNEFVRGQW